MAINLGIEIIDSFRAAFPRKIRIIIDYHEIFSSSLAS